MIETLTRPVFQTTDGKTFTSRYDAEQHEARCVEAAARRRQIDALWDGAKDAYTTLRATLNRHADSGVADSEGHWTLDRWIRRTLLGQKAGRITFEGLEGYTEYKPRPGQLKKGEIARAIARDAHAFVKAVKATARARKIQLTQEIVEGLI